VLRGRMRFRGSEIMSLGVLVSAHSDILLYHSLVLLELFDVDELSHPVFMPKLSTHRMHDSGSNVPHIRPKGFTENQMS
jgi:hypothetical protein